MDQEKQVQIFVALLGEGVDVWRPVNAIAKENGIYQIISENRAPDDEHWEFTTGDLVRCVEKQFSESPSGLVAVAKVDEAT